MFAASKGMFESRNDAIFASQKASPQHVVIEEVANMRDTAVLQEMRKHTYTLFNRVSRLRQELSRRADLLHFGVFRPMRGRRLPKFHQCETHNNTVNPALSNTQVAGRKVRPAGFWWLKRVCLVQSL